MGLYNHKLFTWCLAYKSQKWFLLVKQSNIIMTSELSKIFEICSLFFNEEGLRIQHNHHLSPSEQNWSLSLVIDREIFLRSDYNYQNKRILLLECCCICFKCTFHARHGQSTQADRRAETSLSIQNKLQEILQVLYSNKLQFNSSLYMNIKFLSL